MKRMLLSLAILLLLPSAVSATEYYVDCSASSNGDGSFSSPWNSVVSVNNYNFNTGNDVYFKVDTTCTMSATLQIDWDGSSGDWITIGAYYGDGQFGLNGNPRPTLDGTSTVPSGDSGLIRKNSGIGYIEVKDLHIYRSGWTGIVMKEVDDITIENNYVSYSEHNGIWAGGCADLTITKNVVEQNAQVNNPNKQFNMGTLVASGSDSVTTGAVISYNRIFNNFGSEVLSIFAKLDGAIVEYNVIYDNEHANIALYSNACEDEIIRHNLVYSSSDIGNWKNPSGIVMGNEASNGYCHTGDANIYGNLVAGTKTGITTGAELSGCSQSDNCFYNNALVDTTEYNIRIWSSGLGGSGNEIKNNIFWSITGDGVNANTYSPSGYAWSNNLFYGDGSVTGNAATNAIFANPLLNK
ncbi:MAG: right-handed parallel beta-helix repeat-containing protein, partial [Candidatus Aenigmarchaeota archaeon]|nr:right-handed parallel beta-helix repeat-containing protein [Candidatus Aenigmarchaeota archaeon]